MRRAVRAATLGFSVLLLAVPAGAAQVLVSFAVDATSTLDATLDAIDTETQSVAPSGTIDALVDFSNDPTHGLVVASLQIVGGTLSLVDGDFNLSFATDVSLSVLSTAITLDASSGVLSATATAANTSTIDLGGAEVTGDGGTLDANGSLLGQTVSDNYDLSTASLTATLLAGTTVTAVVQEQPGDDGVTLSMPLDIKVLALNNPMIVPLSLTGVITLSGTTAVPVPGLGLPGLGVVTALLVLGVAGLQRERRARTSDNLIPRRSRGKD